MGYIDTHSHLLSFASMHDDVFKRALSLDRCCLVCLNEHELSLAIRAKRRYPTKFTIACGIYPEDVYDLSEDQRYDFYRLYNHPYVDLVGEIGLEYHWQKDEDKRLLQQEAFVEQIHVANLLHKTINVHTRDAWDDTLRILKAHPTKGIIHCFSGSVEIAVELLKLGFYLSFSGTITYKNANKIIDVIKIAPLNRILTETDSPYLTPVPFRGKQNEPSYVEYVTQTIAKVKQVPLEIVKKQIKDNYSNVLKCL